MHWQEDATPGAVVAGLRKYGSRLDAVLDEVATAIRTREVEEACQYHQSLVNLSVKLGGQVSVWRRLGIVSAWSPIVLHLE